MISSSIRGKRFRRGFRDIAVIMAAVVSTVSANMALAQSQVSSGTGARAGSSSAGQASSIQAGVESYERGDYKSARGHFEGATRGSDSHKAWLGLVRVGLIEGKYDEAVSAAKQAERADRVGGRGRLEAVALLAQALARQGKMDEAISAVRRVENDPDARLARVVLGELLIMTGDTAGARVPLMTLVRDYNNDVITDRDGDDLALVGRASHLLRSAADANDAYNQSEKTGNKSTQLLLWRAELFFEKYDTGHAEEVLREILKRVPEHPDALVLMANVKLEQSYDFWLAEKLADRALAVNPRHAGALLIHAGLALRVNDFQRCEEYVSRGLRTNPNDLGLLSMRAAARFLADDTAGFDSARKAVLSRNRQYSHMYQIIGEYAEWEHRYPEIVAMMREAVLVNQRDGKAWSVLGLNLIRMGEDVEGVSALRKSWQYDKFNVRVYNTLNLYEKDIPTHYETVTEGNFRFRFDKKESALLRRYVQPLMEEAHASMVKRYGFTPELPVGIELYSNPQHFSVRTSGLPRIGIQGVCFGKTLASTSPKSASMNWANVLWHELGHVFAIQITRSRVPRWFTEGLSEYETFLRNPRWQREEDMSLYVALRANRIPKVVDFNRAFTHADRASDIPVAYYAASQIVVYIGEKHGVQKLVEMMRLWGQ
ncbi:MAG: tetratricopeptide repeat protein, partial [Polyangiaceae bacterium]|nr:tetratricopeptide repeat protein [Polyangiaceae bacterium]